jgi:hypothetical protein
MFDNLPVRKAAQRVIGIVPYSKREQLHIEAKTWIVRFNGIETSYRN